MPAGLAMEAECQRMIQDVSPSINLKCFRPRPNKQETEAAHGMNELPDAE
jgi:hypothetical protein